MFSAAGLVHGNGPDELNHLRAAAKLLMERRRPESADGREFASKALGAGVQPGDGAGPPGRQAFVVTLGGVDEAAQVEEGGRDG